MEHIFAPGVLPILAAVIAVGAFAGSGISYLFKLYFWNERRIMEVINLAFRSDAFEHAVEKISTVSRAELEAKVDDLKKRADAQAASIVSAHRRIDAVLQAHGGSERRAG